MKVLVVPSGGSGGGNEVDYGHIAMKLFDVNPNIPGNDTTIVRGLVHLEGTWGIFTFANWLDSKPLWMDGSWSYTETSNTATFVNTPTAIATVGFTGTIYTPGSQSYNIGITRTYTYLQAFP